MLAPAMRTALAIFLTTLALATTADARDFGPTPGEVSPPWDGRTFRTMTDDVTGLSVDVPMHAFRFETRHFGTGLPAGRATEAYTIYGPAGTEEVSIELFDDRDTLGLDGFFDRHLDFMARNASIRRGSTIGVQKTPAIVIEQPSLPGSYARVSAVFARGRRIVRVTCINGESDRAVAVYDRVLESISLRKAAR